MKAQKFYLFISVFLFSFFIASGQDTLSSRMGTLDLKMNLIDTKLQLLDSKISLWELKPAQLELKLAALDKKIAELDFQPAQLNYKFQIMDSLIREQQKITEENRKIDNESDKILFIAPVSNQDLVPEIPPAKYVISILPLRLMEGTLHLSVERVINYKNSIELSGMATYATMEGMANYYLRNQELSYYNDALEMYDPYESENLAGYGVALQWKNYLLPRIKGNYNAPSGLYASTNLMFRRIWIAGMDQFYNEEEDLWEDIEITQLLNIYTGAVYIGWQVILWNVMAVDLYAGGVIRLSKYDTEEDFTRYKKWDNIDFSGVMPGGGIKIGIVK
ncbi:MAG: hypothetical protein JXJ22_03915 [Bacteroidales bacterium]|nr:hypothetical protein [Bacteroidales bacterium]